MIRRRTDPHAAAIESEAERLDALAIRGTGSARAEIAEELADMCMEIVDSRYKRDGGLELCDVRTLIDRAVERLARRRVEVGQ